MNLHSITGRLLDENPLTLFREAAWRARRGVLRSRYRRSIDKACPVRFRPLGYYQVQPDTVSPEIRRHIAVFADSVLRGEYPLMGYGNPNLGIEPDWQCDWVSGKSWPMKPSDTLRTIRHDGSDVKAPWELSRLQFAPVVAKAWVLSGDDRYRATVKHLLEDWVRKNPVGVGINWTIAMEAALRSISICLTVDLLWPFISSERPWLDLITSSLWQHLLFIEGHSEFSHLLRSNHYLSNVTGLTTLAAYLEGPGAAWRLRKYARDVEKEILAQTYADGGDFEASTGYHVLTAQMFLHSYIVQQRRGLAIDDRFESRLKRMFAWIAGLADQDVALPHIGDCDDGRVELLFDDVLQTGLPVAQRNSMRVRSLTETGAQVIGLSRNATEAISLMPESGLAVARAGDAQAILCAMPNGIGGKGSHTHCDKLAVLLRLGTDMVFCDAGSSCYTRSAKLRNVYRSTAVHNTIMVDGEDQNIVSRDAEMLFRCGNEATVSRIETEKCDGALMLRASHSGYRRLGVEHERTVTLSTNKLALVDHLSGEGEHLLELQFLVGPEWRVSVERDNGDLVTCHICGLRDVILRCAAPTALSLAVHPAQISRAYGSDLAATSIRIRASATLPLDLRTEATW